MNICIHIHDRGNSALIKTSASASAIITADMDAVQVVTRMTLDGVGNRRVRDVGMYR